MTIVHILNFSIPIACVFLFGVMVDRMCKPDSTEQEANE